ncbi:GGDEF domain-containing protein [Acetobacteraceae bacterium KSS8]|uniref:diguanylate cyclase n=1 Tax=Endosaccharibacter trunci TaxID=2812733 RepID=A0ABT1W7A4_9PROT|nr:GGDEF domain-containing protein [Acetobacteraceae bacterium KSS8]
MLTTAWRSWLCLSLVFMGLHVAAILLDTTGAGLLNYPFLIADPLIALVAIWRLASGSRSTVLIAWMLLGAGLLIDCAGTVSAAWADAVMHSSPFVADLSGFLYLAYGIAVIAALALPDRPGLVRRLAWIDVVQCILAAFLLYIAVFSAVPFLDKTVLPVSSERLIELLNCENLALLSIATLRVMGRSHSPQRAAFDRAALLFLMLFAVTSAIYNKLGLDSGFVPTLVPVMLDLSFLSLLFLRAAKPDPEPQPEQTRRPLTLLVDGATPAFFTLLLMWLSMSIVNEKFDAGAIAMTIALALMVVRSAITESHHLEAQDALALARDRLLHLTLHDDLTEIANRRAFQNQMAEQWNDPGRRGGLLALLLIDIDHFKTINDRLGHDSGDTCLRMVARALDRTLSKADGTVFRYGGEEFAALLPGATIARAGQIGESLRIAVAQLAIPNRTATGDRVTISIGIAAGRYGRGSSSRLIASADRALYEAKAGGRNRVTIDREPAES